MGKLALPVRQCRADTITGMAERVLTRREPRAPVSAKPLILAHRAGNTLGSLRDAEDIGVDAVEADVRFFRGRLELRHLKTVGPVPVYWDRWELHRPGTPFPTLDALLAAARPSTELLLDLKGFDPRLSRKVIEAIDASGRRQGIAVCSRHWRHLAAFRTRPHVRVVHSVGSPGELRSLWRRSSSVQLDGISIDQRLLTRPVTAELCRRAPLVMAWSVNAARSATRLVEWGVNGLISDEPEMLRGLLHA
jgi:glycerophosphoryl diester phosphodiesterase